MYGSLQERLGGAFSKHYRVCVVSLSLFMRLSTRFDRLSGARGCSGQI
jgi:hypothetical protein